MIWSMKMSCVLRGRVDLLGQGFSGRNTTRSQDVKTVKKINIESQNND